MKRIVKKLSRLSLMHGVAATIARAYVRVVLCTSRTYYDIPDATQPYINGHHPALFVLWHNRMLLIPALNNKKLRLHAMVSQHSDGRLIGHVLKGFGLGVIYGSTSRGGAHAMRQLITLYENGNHIALTPDGPRGPCEIVSHGTAQLALLTHAPVIALSYAAKRVIRLRSWDRFIIPLPFNRIYFVMSAPIVTARVADFPKKAQREQIRLILENNLHEIGATAQRNAHG